MDESTAEAATEAPVTSGLACLVLVARHHGIHLSVPQLVHDHLLSADEATPQQLVRCATSAGMRAKALTLSWKNLTGLDKALPAIVTFQNGSRMLLLRTEGKEHEKVVLRDPNAGEDALLVIDAARFQAAWNGEVILVRRSYQIRDETKPFSFGLVFTLIFRERRIARDLAICALALSAFALAPILFFRLLTSRVLYYHAMNTFVVLCVLMAIAIVFEAAFGFFRRSLVLHLTTRVDVKLATYMFDKVLNLPMDFFERTPVGLITRDMNEIWRIRSFMTGALFGTMLDAFVLVIFIPVMFFFNPILTVVVLAMCSIIVSWVIFMLPVYRRRTAAVMQSEGARGSFLVQTIQGIRTVKSLALDARERHQWDILVARVAKDRFAEGAASNLIQTVVTPLERLMISGTFALGVYLAISTNDPMYVGSLYAYLLLSQRVAHPLMQMAQLVHQYEETRAAVATVAALVNQTEEQGRSAHSVRIPIQGQIDFMDVSFRYRGAGSLALDSVSFEVPSGTILGIMGRSGSGKTTITRLLQRLHADYHGLIKIDGVDVREYDIDYLRGRLGVVLQDSFLFSGSIRDNITAGKSDASFEEMVHAARLAGAEEFIDKLPRGYETFVYEGSPNLSGGQRQRIAIARALIVNPRILILDEATSALDAESETIINNNLLRIASGRTMIIISHRLSSLVPADAILVLERGQVVDVGKHEELLDRCDIYSGLWHQQNRHIASDNRNRRALRGPSAS